MDGVEEGCSIFSPQEDRILRVMKYDQVENKPLLGHDTVK